MSRQGRLLFLQIHLGMVDFDSSSSPPQRTLAEQKNESRNTIPFQMRITFDWSRSNANHRMQICSYWRLLLILFRWVHQEGRAELSGPPHCKWWEQELRAVWWTQLSSASVSTEQLVRCLYLPPVLSLPVDSGTVARAPACPGQHSWHAAHQTTDTGHHCVMSWGQLQWEQDI